MQLFSFLITWRSSSSKSAVVYKISSNRMIFRWDMAIYRFLKWRPSAILELFYHHTRSPTKSVAGSIMQLPVKFHVNLIHRSEDIATWIFHMAWNAYSGPKNGGCGGLWTPKCDYSLSRPPKGTSLRKSASVKLSTVKIRWGVWSVGELTESVTDTHTHLHTHTGKLIFCPCIALDRQFPSTLLKVIGN